MKLFLILDLISFLKTAKNWIWFFLTSLFPLFFPAKLQFYLMSLLSDWACFIFFNFFVAPMLDVKINLLFKKDAEQCTCIAIKCNLRGLWRSGCPCHTTYLKWNLTCAQFSLNVSAKVSLWTTRSITKEVPLGAFAISFRAVLYLQMKIQNTTNKTL